MRRRSLLLMLPASASFAAPAALPSTVVHFQVEAPGQSAEQIETTITTALERGLMRLPDVARTATTSTEGGSFGEIAFQREAGAAERTRVAALLAREPALAALVWQVRLAAPKALLQP